MLDGINYIFPNKGLVKSSIKYKGDRFSGLEFDGEPFWNYLKKGTAVSMALFDVFFEWALRHKTSASAYESYDFKNLDDGSCGFHIMLFGLEHLRKKEDAASKRKEDVISSGTF